MMRIPKLSKKILTVAVSILLMAGFAFAGAAPFGQRAAADPAPVNCPAGKVSIDPNKPCIAAPPPATADPAQKRKCTNDCGLISKYANPLINFLAIIVGLVVTISIVVGGIQYASSQDDPQKVQAAKTRIVNSILALLAFLFLYVFLQWLVPGGF